MANISQQTTYTSGTYLTITEGEAPNRLIRIYNDSRILEIQESSPDHFVKVYTGGTQPAVEYKLTDITLNVSGEETPASGDPIDLWIDKLVQTFIPEQTSGTVDATLTGTPTVQISSLPAANTDLFGSVISRTPASQFDNAFIYSGNDDVFEVVAVGTGTAVFQIGKTARELLAPANNDKVYLRTRARGVYLKGYAYRTTFTMAGCDTTANHEKGFYYGDPRFQSPYNTLRDGIFLIFENNSARIEICNREHPAENGIYPQAGWLDPLDGSGTSGYTINWDKDNIFQLEFQWLGAGTVEMRLLTGTHGVIPFFRQHHQNSRTTPYMRSPHHSIGWYSHNKGSAPTPMLVYCLNADAGLAAPQGRNSSLGLPDAGITLPNQGTMYAAMGLRFKPTTGLTTAQEFEAALINDYIVDLLTNGNSEFEWELQVNPVLSNDAAFWATTRTIANSSLEGSTNNVLGTITTPGEVLAAGTSRRQMNNMSTVASLRKLGVLMASNVSETICLCIKSLSLNNLTINGNLNWKEYR